MVWPFDDAVAALNGLYDLVISLGVALLMALIYPFVVILSVIQSIWSAFYTIFADFFNVLLLVPNTFIDVLNAFFVGVLPSAILGLMALNLGLVVGLRLYSFAKDVSILGFKI